MTRILNSFVAVFSATVAGLQFQEDRAFAILVLITAFLFGIGYFNIEDESNEDENKKSVM